jgi:tripartite-type tricarboxylate transporter receptor subunit TctC
LLAALRIQAVSSWKLRAGTEGWVTSTSGASTPLRNGLEVAALQAIRAAAAKVQADPAYRAKGEALNFDVATEDVPAFEKTIAAETKRWAELVKTTCFKAAD